jgi:hypothetical protein
MSGDDFYTQARTNDAYTHEVYGHHSHGFSSTLIETGWTSYSSIRCYNTECNADNTSYDITVGDQTLTCSSNSQVISNVSGYSGTLTCSLNIEHFCRARHACLDNCSGKGYCLSS